jgi:hypothetical protein
MLEFVPRNLRGDVLMATETKLVPGLKKVVFVLRGMRIMTFHAISFHRDLVRASRIRGNDPFVAGKADPAHVPRKKLSVGGGMRIVAVGAVPAFHRGMEERKAQFFLERYVAIQAYLPFRPGFQAEFVLGVGRWNRHQGNDRDERQRGPGSMPHDFSSFLFHRFSVRWQSSQDREANGG